MALRHILVDQEKQASEKLRLYSMWRLETLLGKSRVELRDVASNAGRCYSPFPKKVCPRPFQKHPRPPKKRQIDNPVGDLKDIQTRIYQRILKPLVLPSHICGGVKGKTVLANVRMHFGARTLVTLDIRNFFPSITNLQVYNVWRRHLDCSLEISKLLTKLTTFERHLPQGAPTSTLLANLVLSSVDGQIRRECARKGVQYSNWVDDLAFSGDNARDIINTAVETLRDAGLSVSHKKMKIMGPGDRKVLNGVLMGKFPSLPRERIARLRSGVHKLQSDQVPSPEVEKYIRSLRGRINHLKTIAPQKAEPLTKALAAAAENRGFSL